MAVTRSLEDLDKGGKKEQELSVWLVLTVKQSTEKSPVQVLSLTVEQRGTSRCHLLRFPGCTGVSVYAIPGCCTFPLPLARVPWNAERNGDCVLQGNVNDKDKEENVFFLNFLV